MFLKSLIICLSVLFLVACGGGHNKTNIEFIQDMMDQPSLKSQEYDEVRKESAMRLPPEGTVARNKAPYKYKGDPVAAESVLSNPTDASDSKTIEMGKTKYAIYCAVCHGKTGAGDGSVAEYMALKPPSLLTEKAKAFKDGRIYHIITDGQGVMGSYATQIQNENERWAIVNYVRSLQGDSNGR